MESLLLCDTKLNVHIEGIIVVGLIYSQISMLPMRCAGRGHSALAAEAVYRVSRSRCTQHLTQRELLAHCRQVPPCFTSPLPHVHVAKQESLPTTLPETVHQSFLGYCAARQSHFVQILMAELLVLQ
jgi:hypothetical protein